MDPRLVAYANAALGRPVIVDDAALVRHGFNAACMSAPGGPIIVSGSLEAYGGTPELAAFTLAHEIGHAVDFADAARMSFYVNEVIPRVWSGRATPGDRLFLYSQEVVADLHGAAVLQRLGLVGGLDRFFAAREPSLFKYRKLYFELNMAPPVVPPGARCPVKCVCCGDA